MPKIKAKKVKPEIRKVEKPAKKSKRNQMLFLVLLMLILSGFVLGGITYNFTNPEVPTTADNVELGYNIAEYVSSSELSAVNLSLGYGVFTNFGTASQLKSRFGGEIVVIENFVPVLFITNYKELERIEERLDEESLVYFVGTCSADGSETPCLVERNSNSETSDLFDVYRLSEDSKLLSGNKFGLQNTG